MHKVIKIIDNILPWAVVTLCVYDTVHYWGTDTTRTVISIVAIVGWLSVIELRGEYYSLLDMVKGSVKNES
jgi:hypothetical protein